MKKLKNVIFNEDSVEFTIDNEPTIIETNTIFLNDGTILKVSDKWLNYELCYNDIKFLMKNIVIYDNEFLYIYLDSVIRKLKIDEIVMEEVA